MILARYDRAAARLQSLAPAALPTFARFVFAAVLAGYFWASARTKLGDGFWGFLNPSDGAYVQIFPRAMEAAGYDAGQLGLIHWLVVVAGSLAEFILPLLLVLGLFARLAAVGMLAFVIVQSLTDIYGHGVAGDDLGRWFDASSGALIWDQRSLWAVLLLVLIFCGAGPFSIDHLLVKARQ